MRAGGSVVALCALTGPVGKRSLDHLCEFSSTLAVYGFGSPNVDIAILAGKTLHLITVVEEVIAGFPTSPATGKLEAAQGYSWAFLEDVLGDQLQYASGCESLTSTSLTKEDECGSAPSRSRIHERLCRILVHVIVGLPFGKDAIYAEAGMLSVKSSPVAMHAAIMDDYGIVCALTAHARISVVIQLCRLQGPRPRHDSEVGIHSTSAGIVQCHSAVESKLSHSFIVEIGQRQQWQFVRKPLLELLRPHGCCKTGTMVIADGSTKGSSKLVPSCASTHKSVVRRHV
mmetsp:Transcript_68968/g.121970  ORF Transcript_68968/g.121970 Transcript_68968/m.121970 type:complete len:286 (+) Transcript_68968:1218-2075(+)